MMASVPSGLAPSRVMLLDWAGTRINHGSPRPIEHFVRVFQSRGLEISAEAAQGQRAEKAITS